MVAYSTINATGATVISGLTLTAALYLLVLLLLQGRGKLRVKLLVGMVVSDLCLGLVVLPPDVMYLANVPLKAGTAGCTAQAFLLVVILFTQHMWTLAIAIATFLLLRHPLSKAAYYMERYSWAIGPIIWACSILHASLWYHHVGFTDTGSICYYGSKSKVSGLDRDLVQFIPRCFVFVTTLSLYSRLFTFLRRPDTIQLSSNTSTGPCDRGKAAVKPKRPPFGRVGSSRSDVPSHNPDAPWEALEFIQVGNIDMCLDVSPVPPTEPVQQYTSGVPNGIIRSSSRPVSPLLDTHAALDTASASGRYVTPGHDGSDASQYERRTSDASVRFLTASPAIPTQPLTPIISQGSGSATRVEDSEGQMGQTSSQMGKTGAVYEEEEDGGQTMKEFFSEYQVNVLEDGRHASSNGMPMSASSYFNKQASLLMLYFPLAYMFVFSMSLVRLIYDMVHTASNPVLGIMSNWMVLSVGLIDGIVYGVAEFMVKRKVRRKMPEHI